MQPGNALWVAEISSRRGCRWSASRRAGRLRGMAIDSTDYQPGMRVRVTQQIPFGRHASSTTIEGEIIRFGQQKTGSWYAHARDDRLWLDKNENTDPELAAFVEEES